MSLSKIKGVLFRCFKSFIKIWIDELAVIGEPQNGQSIFRNMLLPILMSRVEVIARVSDMEDTESLDVEPISPTEVSGYLLKIYLQLHCFC